MDDIEIEGEKPAETEADVKPEQIDISLFEENYPKYCEQIDSRKTLQTALKVAGREVDKNNIILSLQSDFEYKIVDEAREEMTAYFRAACNNRTIRIQLKVAPREPDEKERWKALTDDEKARYLEEKNPVFKEFRRKFKTTFNYS